MTFTELVSRVDALSRLPLLDGPTPLEEYPALAKMLDVETLWVKRDDLTGLAFGGTRSGNLRCS